MGIFENLEARVSQLESAVLGQKVGQNPPEPAPVVPEPPVEPVASTETTADSSGSPTEPPSTTVGAVPEPDPELGEGYPTRDNSEVDPSAGSQESSPEPGEPGTSGT